MGFCVSRQAEFPILIERFERELPFREISLQEYEERVKRLVFADDNNKVTLNQLIESFSDSVPFSQILIDDSILRQMLLSKFLRADIEQKKQVTFVDRKYEIEGETKIKVTSLMALGILYCKANDSTKANTFYELIQNGLQNQVDSHDRDLASIYIEMLIFSTVFISHFTSVEEHQRVSDAQDEEEIRKMKSVYEEIKDDMLDKIFGNQSKISRETFIDKVTHEVSDYFRPHCIRKIISEKKLPIVDASLPEFKGGR